MFEKTYPETLRIEVTREDINAGIRGDMFACPIARATRRMFPDEYVSVGSTVKINGVKYSGNEVYNFVQRFDGKLSVSPQTFEVTRIK